MNIQLIADQLNQHEHAKIILSHPDYPPIVGFRQDDFQLTGSAEFSNVFENHLSDKNAWAQAFASSVQNFIGTDVALPNLKSQAQSLHQWVSSQRPQIPITFQAVRVRESDPRVDHLQATLVGATMPTSRDGKLLSGLLNAPGGYRATGFRQGVAEADEFDATNDAGGSRSKTWTVKIGKHFQASLLVLRNADCGVSVACCPDGSPQYGIFTLQFEPIVVPNEEDVRGWFGLPPISHN